MPPDSEAGECTCNLKSKEGGVGRRGCEKMEERRRGGGGIVGCK